MKFNKTNREIFYFEDKDNGFYAEIDGKNYHVRIEKRIRKLMKTTAYDYNFEDDAKAVDFVKLKYKEWIE